jgi:3-methyladenine DNA glycosylase/8-oxoguanine DNA glycosylase
VRGDRRARDARCVDNVARLLLRLPEPYSFDISTERFRVFGLDLANVWDDGALLRVVAGREVRITAAPGGVDVAPLDAETRPVVEHLLGLRFDLGPFTAWAATEPVLGPLVARLAGFRPTLVPDPFESLVTSITAQQISLRAAGAIRSRFIAAFGVPAGRAYAFPLRERVAEAAELELVGLGFSRKKAEYTIALARNPIELDSLHALGDDEIRALLTSLPGIGAWTAEWFLARHLARPTAWPAGDLALRRAVDLFYGSDVRDLGQRLHPFQNLSAHYLLTASRNP